MRLEDVIIVGAGASGLMIARKLSQAGLTVVILEARDRLGGRIYTIEDPAFIMPLEAGAEFVHGELPITQNLFKEAGMHTRASGGDSWRFIRGALTRDDDFMEKDDVLTKKLRELKEDMTVAEFLEKYFGDDKHANTRQEVKGFVEGYDAADITRASAFTLRSEWEEMSEGRQYRVDGGYIGMIRLLADECRKKDCLIYTSAVVKQVNWSAGNVEVITGDHQRYISRKLVVTVPLGVLSLHNHETSAIAFSPSLDGKNDPIKDLGYGGVIKVLLLFKHAFWKDPEFTEGKDLEKMGWLFSDATIPTWWTQYPDNSALLTGWLAGPKAAAYRDADNSKIVHEALKSIGSLFQLRPEELFGMLAYSSVTNWLADPFSLGAYSYATPQTEAARKQLGIPMENTLFFAGEALFDGPEIGTVEAALGNGLQVAKKIIDNNSVAG